MPRWIGWGLVAAGLVLVAASALVAFVVGDDTVGSPEIVEARLREASPTPAAAVEPSRDTAPGREWSTPVATVPPGDDTPGAGPAPAPAPEESGALPEPTGLRIPAIEISAPIAAYGVDQRTRQMDVPDNVTDVAWYEFGPSPGAPGSAVLAAHVDLFDQGPGVFFELNKLEVDDVVEIAYADGSSRTFRVIARTEYEKDELPTGAIFAKQGPAVLTLITCGGNFSRSNRSYDSNVVVYAVPAGADDPLAPGSVG